MKNIYIAITIEENEKHIHYVLKHNTNTNLKHSLDIKNLVVAHYCNTKKEAYRVVKVWNQIAEFNERTEL